jgi:hypothetical protein
LLIVSILTEVGVGGDRCVARDNDFLVRQNVLLHLMEPVVLPREVVLVIYDVLVRHRLEPVLVRIQHLFGFFEGTLGLLCEVLSGNWAFVLRHQLEEGDLLGVGV